MHKDLFNVLMKLFHFTKLLRFMVSFGQQNKNFKYYKQKKQQKKTKKCFVVYIGYDTLIHKPICL